MKKWILLFIATSITSLHAMAGCPTADDLSDLDAPHVKAALIELVNNEASSYQDVIGIAQEQDIENRDFAAAIRTVGKILFCATEATSK